MKHQLFSVYIAIKYFAKLLRPKPEYSDFMRDLTATVLHETHPFYAFAQLRRFRKELFRSKRVIGVTDFGAGSRVFSSLQRQVGQVAKVSAVSEKQGELLFRLVNGFKPQTILEMGTSLGLGTAYLAKPNAAARLVTIEGCPETATLAQQNFSKWKLDNIDARVGAFDLILPKVLADYPVLDFVYIDGNHCGNALLRYWNMLEPALHEKSVVVIDDINWSADMQEAWLNIVQKGRACVTVDLLRCGLVFFRKEITKAHCTIRF